MKKFLILVLLIPVSAAYAQKKPIPKKTLPVKTMPIFRNSMDSFSYAIGLEGAAYYKNQGVTQVNADLVKRAFEDVYGNKTLLLTPEQTNMTIQQILQACQAEKMKGIKEETTKFMETNKKRPGVQVLPSGLQYEILKQGTGAIPKVTDTVKAHYVGTLLNGTEFDNSYKKGEPLQIPVNGVIAGWVQALQMMPVGSKWKLFIPSDLAYGDRGAGNGAIPGGAALIFEIELMEIVHTK